MNEVVKAKWLERLRDPESKQIKKALKTDEGNCCLGVLCEIAVAEGVIPMNPPDQSSEGQYRFGNHNNVGVLPEQVTIWAGLDGNNPYVTFDSGDDEDFNSVPLTHLNDHHGKSFVEIADLIEKNL